jgi:ABC-type multidrug transport system fused ATPase/permease subunit
MAAFFDDDSRHKQNHCGSNLDDLAFQGAFVLVVMLMMMLVMMFMMMFVTVMVLVFAALVVVVFVLMNVCHIFSVFTLQRNGKSFATELQSLPHQRSIVEQNKNFCEEIRDGDDASIIRMYPAQKQVHAKISEGHAEEGKDAVNMEKQGFLE